MRIALVLILVAWGTSSAMAGIISEGGAGYHSSFYDAGRFVGDSGRFSDAFNWTDVPFGVGAYGNIGWGFGAKNAFGAGLEGYGAIDMGSVDSRFTLGVSYQLRLFASFQPIDLLNFTAFAGLGSTEFAIFPGTELSVRNFVLGSRLKVLFFFVDYSVKLANNEGASGLHEILIGISF